MSPQRRSAKPAAEPVPAFENAAGNGLPRVARTGWRNRQASFGTGSGDSTTGKMFMQRQSLVLP